LLDKATSDDAHTPGYVYEEIGKLSFLSTNHCSNLAAYLEKRLERGNHIGQQKVGLF